MARTVCSAFCFFGLLLTASAVGQGNKQSPAVSMITATGEAAKYWPGWRGPTRQGLAEDGAYPDTWSPTENVLWKIKVPGAGNSSPVIWKDRLFLTTAYDQGKKRSVLCFNLANGDKLWEKFIPPGAVEEAQGKNGYASGTPCTDGERIYAYFGNFGMLCLDFEGKQIWHKTVPTIDAYHGPSCSPLLYKDSVIIFQDHRKKGGSFVAAYDKLTGEEIWKKPRTETVGWGSAIAIRVGEQDQLIVSSSLKVYAYDPADGKELWTVKGNLFEVTPTPVVGHGMVYCCSGRAGPTLAIHPTGSGDITKTHVEWQTIKGSPFIPSPLLYGEYLYIVNDIISVVTCFDAKKGKIHWQKRLGAEVKHGFSASPIGVNGKVFFTNDEGETFVLKVGPTFEHLATNDMQEKTLASPALVAGRWYIRTEGHLYCIGKGKG